MARVESSKWTKLQPENPSRFEVHPIRITGTTEKQSRRRCLHCIAKVGSNIWPRMPVTTKIIFIMCIYIYILEFLVGKPNLSLHLPLESWMGGGSFAKGTTKLVGRWYTLSGAKLCSTYHNHTIQIYCTGCFHNDAWWSQMKRMHTGSMAAAPLPQTTWNRSLQYFAGQTCAFYSCLLCHFLGHARPYLSHLTFFSGGDMLRGVLATPGFSEAVSKQSSSLQSLRQKLQKVRPCWGWTQDFSWL